MRENPDSMSRKARRVKEIANNMGIEENEDIFL